MMAPPATQLERGALIGVEIVVTPPGAAPVGVEAYDGAAATSGDDRVGAAPREDYPLRPAPPGLLAIVWILGWTLRNFQIRKFLHPKFPFVVWLPPSW